MSTIIQPNAEAGCARVITAMRGVVLSVKTLAILAAENPDGKPATASDNEAANQKPEKSLRGMNLGFVRVDGQYAGPKHSFFVPNITRDEALQRGKSFTQQFIIFGEKVHDSKDGNEYDGFEFSLIFTDYRFGDVGGTRRMLVNIEDAADYCTIVDGHEFRVPFFDGGKYENIEFNAGSGVVDKRNITTDAINAIQEQSDRASDPGRTGKSRWMNRGVLWEMLRTHHSREDACSISEDIVEI